MFVENPDPAHPHPLGLNVQNGAISLVISTNASATDEEIERKIVSALGNAGIQASGGPTLFSGQTLSGRAKAAILQKGFDAVLYVSIVTNGRLTTLIEGASHDGQYLYRVGTDPEPINDTIVGMFDLKPDGSVWRDVPTFHAKCDLQDTKTNKIVWSSETITTGGSLVVLSRASDQIVEKMRSDGAI